MFSFVIQNGLVVDGSGAPAFVADVGVTGERVTAVGNLRGAEAAAVIDATGQVIAPGFIDIHTHSDLTLLAEPYGMSKVRQGVTSEVCGNCGFSPFPISVASGPLLRARLSGIFGETVDLDMDGFTGLS